VSNKIAAIYIGPAGFALIGQFQNFSSIVMSLANGGVNNGVVKYIAEYHEDEDKRANIVSTALYVTLGCSIIISILLIIFRSSLSVYLFKSDEYASIFLAFALSLIFFSVNALFLNVLNGYKEISKYIRINIASSIVSLFFTALLIFYMGLYGALLAYVTSQAVVFFITLFLIMRSDWFNMATLLRGYDKESLIKLGGFSLMLLTTSLTFPVSHIFIRNYIIKHISLDAAGYWQGIWSISTGYLLIITTALNTYYLPRLSEIRKSSELREEIFSGYRILLPVVAVLAAGIYFSRDFIIDVLFSEQFFPMKDLFAFQLIGDFIKIAGFILGFLTIAKAMTKVYILCEIGFTLTFVILSMLFINRFGLVGITYAYTINYAFYLLLMVYIFRHLIFRKVGLA
jgi:PST family polysaccharide transporter